MLSPKFANRMTEVQASAISALAETVASMKNTGVDVAGLHEGELDLDPYQEIKNATVSAIAAGKTRYSALSGEMELKQAICNKALIDNNFRCSPENIVVANGSTQIIYQLINIFAGAGDEVIIPIPCWPNYVDATRLAGARPVLVPVTDRGLDADVVESAISDKTKLIIINNPSNPTGYVYSQASLEDLSRLARKHGVILISDEAYERFVYGPDSHFSIGSLSDGEHVVTVQSFSKSYAMTGFRVGYAIASQSIVQRLLIIQGQLSDNVCPFVQHGAVAALGASTEAALELKNLMRKRRDFAAGAISSVLDVHRPAGGFYLFLNVKDLLRSGDSCTNEFCLRLLRQHQVAVVPGNVFHAPGHIRISFASGMANLEAGMKRLVQALS